MSLRIGDNFSYLGKKFLDSRESFDTLREMYACTDVPEGFITYCKEDEKRYEFKNNEWIEFVVSGGNIDIDLEDYATKEYVNDIVESIDVTDQLVDYAKKTDLHSHTNKSTLDGISSTDVTNWNSAYTHSTSSHAPSDAQKNSDITKAEIENKLTGNITSHTHNQYLTEHQDISGKVDKEEGKGLSTNDLTNTLKSNYDTAYTHSQSTHAPSDAQKNSDITKAEIEDKLTGNITSHTHDQYLTEHQDISHLAEKDYVDEVLKGVDITEQLQEYAKLTDLDGLFDDVALNEQETTDNQTAIDFYSNGEVVKTVYFSGGSGGGSSTSAYISTELSENILVSTGENFDLTLDFSSPNLGKGTLKVFINDIDAVTKSIGQGESTTPISGDLFSKGQNKIVVYVLDRVGVMSNSLTFYVRYGSLEITSDFDTYTAYDYGSVVRYYFTPTAVDTSLSLTMYMSIDGQTQTGVSCTSDTRGYFTFPSNLSVGNHLCKAWVQDSNGSLSNELVFNLIILDDTELVVATDTHNTVSIEEGEQLSLDYKVYMKGNSKFNVYVYVDGEMVNRGTCGLATSYYKTSSLTEGIHTIKIEAYDITETKMDYVTWTIEITPSTYQMKMPTTAGAILIATAKNKSNADENREIWVGTNQDGDRIEAELVNFSFNDESGWGDDQLLITGDSYVEIPIAPLSDNAKYGFTLDIEFSTKPIGVEDALVLDLWDEENNCGIKITTEELIMQSKAGNRCDLYFEEDVTTSAMFVIDRHEKTAKVYLNGVMCEAFHLTDYEANGVKYLEDFTVTKNIKLGGSGHTAIKNIRVYQVALTTDEIINNFISNETVKSKQRELVEFQKGNDLPTMTIYGDFSGLGKNDKKPCDIVYVSTDTNKYGESFTIDGKYSQLQYQGTSSMAYPIKNYRINPRDKNGKKKINPFIGGKPESRFTLKADFITSNHAHNTGMAKFINDKLYNYNDKDEKTMNPMRWHLLQSGGDVNTVRETINGFPIRLILVNDGSNALNEGQAEPTPGNTKDMGIFNFNNDKDNVKTLGFDTDIFPNCMSFEVTANSDTSAGAFVPYTPDIEYFLKSSDNTICSVFLPKDMIYINDSTTLSCDVKMVKVDEYNDFNWRNVRSINSTKITMTYFTGNNFVILFAQEPTTLTINGTTYNMKKIDQPSENKMFSNDGELEYLQNSFELRFPDEDDVGKDYGYLSINGDTSMGLKRVIDWVGNCTDEEFVRDFELYFNKHYTLRYYLLVVLMAGVDNLGRQFCRV